MPKRLLKSSGSAQSLEVLSSHLAAIKIVRRKESNMTTNGYGAIPLAVAAALIMVSCGSVQNTQVAQQGVAQFHQQLDSEQYHSIYTESDERFRGASSEADFNAILTAVHRKLGNVRNANLKSFQVGWFAGQGQTVTLFYQTQFAEGSADERFIWHVKDKQALLVGYNINSKELITR